MSIVKKQFITFNTYWFAGPTAKRRKVEVDERELRIPLEHGWHRETVINGVSRTGVVKGEVTYYSPCGRRFKQYPDVVRVSVIVHMRFLYMCILLAPYYKVKGEVVPVGKHHIMMRYGE